MDKREALRTMLNNFINDKPEEAALNLHSYLTQKASEITGLGASAPVIDDDAAGAADVDAADVAAK